METKTPINKFWVLSDGWTSAPGAIALSGGKWFSNVKFYATAFLLEHPSKGLILIDTGYSSRVKEMHGLCPMIYRAIVPVHLTAPDGIAGCIKGLGFAPEDVAHVVLTHLHPDHIGSLRDFKNAKIHLHSEGIKLLREERRLIRNIVFKELLPDDFWMRVSPIQEDVLGDNSLWAIDLPGHAIGQVGIIFQRSNQKVFLPSDACWLSQSYRNNILPHGITNIIHDTEAYQASLHRVHNMAIAFPDMLILPSHCTKTASLICK